MKKDARRKAVKSNAQIKYKFSLKDNYTKYRTFFHIIFLDAYALSNTRKFIHFLHHILRTVRDLWTSITLMFSEGKDFRLQNRNIWLHLLIDSFGIFSILSSILHRIKPDIATYQNITFSKFAQIDVLVLFAPFYKKTILYDGNISISITEITISITEKVHFSGIRLALLFEFQY